MAGSGIGLYATHLVGARYQSSQDHSTMGPANPYLGFKSLPISCYEISLKHLML